MNSGKRLETQTVAFEDDDEGNDTYDDSATIDSLIKSEDRDDAHEYDNNTFITDEEEDLDAVNEKIMFKVTFAVMKRKVYPNCHLYA